MHATTGKARTTAPTMHLSLSLCCYWWVRVSVSPGGDTFCSWFCPDIHLDMSLCKCLCPPQTINLKPSLSTLNCPLLFESVSTLIHLNPSLNVSVHIINHLCPPLSCHLKLSLFIFIRPPFSVHVKLSLSTLNCPTVCQPLSVFLKPSLSSLNCFCLPSLLSALICLCPPSSFHLKLSPSTISVLLDPYLSTFHCLCLTITVSVHLYLSTLNCRCQPLSVLFNPSVHLNLSLFTFIFLP